MGLDMYLHGKLSISTYELEPDATPENEFQKQLVKDAQLIKDLKPLVADKCAFANHFKVNEICFNLAQWRKANQIHSWFVREIQENQDDCGEYYVGKEYLEELLTLCNEVLANWENKEKVLELLPPVDGFFFGSTDIDDYYKEDIEYTKETLTKVFKAQKETNDGCWFSYYYSSSW